MSTPAAFDTVKPTRFSLAPNVPVWSADRGLGPMVFSRETVIPLLRYLSIARRLSEHELRIKYSFECSEKLKNFPLRHPELDSGSTVLWAFKALDSGSNPE